LASELILDLFEEFWGARLTHNSMRRRSAADIPPGWDKKVLAFATMDGKIAIETC
jgi:hypothetical protein